jgi:hypothetical protein
VDSSEFKKDFLESIKTAATVTGEGSCAAFVDNMSQYLIDSEALSDFNLSFYTGKAGRSKYRVDGYVYDEFDNTMNLAIANFDGNDFERRLTSSMAMHDFGQLILFLRTALKTDLYQEIEMSTPCADLVDFLRLNSKNIRKYRLLIFTDAELSSAVKTVEIDDYEGVPVEGQIWDIDRLFRVCCSEQGRQIIEIDFRQYCPEGIPCLEASTVSTDQYSSYLGVIPGSVLADIYDRYGSKLLEGNVRSFLSTKVAVNKKIRATILNTPQMFFAFNNGISATALDVDIENTDHGKFITYARDFQIINGGQTTASISNARYKDKADLSEIYVQMKLTAIDESSPEESDELIRNISRSSNSQNKVSDADFFASHPFHRRMEQISRLMFAPATDGAQYETKWFYERARGQYLQEQMRLTPAKKKQFELQNPKNKVIKKTDLAKVQNTWRGFPHTVSKGAQTNFASFAEYIDEQWTANDEQFNDRYFQSTCALILMFQFLERQITRQSWYEGGYRANVIYYTVAQFHRLVKQQFPGSDLDLSIIWNRQGLPEPIESSLLALSELVFERITDPKRKIMNVTQWCKRLECWETVKTVKLSLPSNLDGCLITIDQEKDAQKAAKKEQKVVNELNAQIEVMKYTSDQWKSLSEFAVKNHLVTPTDVSALAIACKIPEKLPNTYQSKRLLALLKKAIEEGFNISQ